MAKLFFFFSISLVVSHNDREVRTFFVEVLIDVALVILLRGCVLCCFTLAWLILGVFGWLA